MSLTHYQRVLFEAAIDAFMAKDEADEQHERMMQGWMNDLDQQKNEDANHDS